MRENSDICVPDRQRHFIEFWIESTACPPSSNTSTIDQKFSWPPCEPHRTEVGDEEDALLLRSQLTFESLLLAHRRSFWSGQVGASYVPRRATGNNRRVQTEQGPHDLFERSIALRLARIRSYRASVARTFRSMLELCHQTLVPSRAHAAAPFGSATVECTSRKVLIITGANSSPVTSCTTILDRPTTTGTIGLVGPCPRQYTTERLGHHRGMNKDLQDIECSPLR